MKILEVLTEKRKTGNVGEDAAANFLKKKKYKILERNYVALGNEIDIIAEDREHLVFCEVKTRTQGHNNSWEPRPASSVTPSKQRKLITTAKYYIGALNSGRRIRFDVIEVIISKEKEVLSIVHIESAFNLNTSRGR